MPGRRKQRGAALSTAHQRGSRLGGCLGIFFFGIFFAVGSGMLYYFSLRPLAYVLLARDWAETPCTILSSNVEASSDGDTFKIVISYTYDVDGRPHESESYNFMPDMYSSGRTGKQEVVRSYPPGAQAICYVNPSDPSQSVLNRGLTADMWWGLFPIPFFLVGAGGLLACTGLIRFGRGQPRGAALSTGRKVSARRGSSSYDTRDADDGPQVLKESVSPIGKFIGTLLFSLIWNGIVSVFVWQAVESFRRGRPEWCLTVFMVPFVLVGVISLALIVHAFLAIFNPRPTLTLSRRRIPLGETARLQWKFSGSTSAIRSLKVSLKGEEQATYRRGTDTHVDKETFHEEMLLESHDSLDIAAGECEIRIPSDTMHTFSANRNKIVWTLHFAGEIPLRPDVSSEFEITVSPHEPTHY